MPIQPGDPLPDVSLAVIGGQRSPASTRALLGTGKTVLFAVPGAFTPTCSNRHLPGYVAQMAAFRARGITVACLAVNDAHVLKAWAEAQQVPPDLLMLADGNGEFTVALGLALDGSRYGMGLRARRFALYAQDGVVIWLDAEAPGELRVSTAEAVLARLDAH